MMQTFNSHAIILILFVHPLLFYWIYYFIFVLAMASVDGFHIFGEEVQMNHGDKVQEVLTAQQGNSAIPRLNWTPLMPAHVLEKFSNLVAEGVRTDKGFKDFHVNAVAKDLQAFIQQLVTGTQVYNHLHKWRTKWVKVCRLK
jgi:hypothetical protein